jgi:hypothetical protein
LTQKPILGKTAQNNLIIPVSRQFMTDVNLKKSKSSTHEEGMYQESGDI